MAKSVVNDLLVAAVLGPIFRVSWWRMLLPWFWVSAILTGSVVSLAGSVGESNLLQRVADRVNGHSEVSTICRNMNDRVPDIRPLAPVRLAVTQWCAEVEAVNDIYFNCR